MLDQANSTILCVYINDVFFDVNLSLLRSIARLSLLFGGAHGRGKGAEW